MASPSSPSFDDGLERLEALVQQLEGGTLTLEDALQRFEEGIGLSKELQQQLADAHRRVEILKQSLGGEYRAEPLEGDNA
jgi:exodeoxyribonuclease VII small subunit